MSQYAKLSETAVLKTCENQITRYPVLQDIILIEFLRKQKIQLYPAKRDIIWSTANKSEHKSG